ncbi:MAG: flagellar hook-basal body complex protein, partial [Alphaproteobacteria bacterium]|nr:flagellar hook-basal body complex protein [Alphaproteobacteria bacterium]
IRIFEATFSPQPTSALVVSANLPASADTNASFNTQSVQIFDSLGTARTLGLSWTKAGPNQWRLGIDAPDSALDPLSGSFPGAADNAASTTTPTPAAPAQAQVSTITLSGAAGDAGDIYTVTIGGAAFTYTTNGLEGGMNAIATALAGQINANLAVPVTAAALGTAIALTADTAGVPFSASASVSNAPAGQANSFATATPNPPVSAVAQINTVTIGGAMGDAGDVYTVIVNGIPFSYTATGAEATANDVAGALAALVNANGPLPVSAAAAGGVVTLLADTAGQPFTLASNVANAGAGSNNNTIVNASVQPNVAAQSQISSVTVGGPLGDTGDVYSVTINGSTYATTTTGGELSNFDITNQLAIAINADAALPVTATIVGGVLRLTGDAPGVPFTVSSSVADTPGGLVVNTVSTATGTPNQPATAQTSAVTLAGTLGDAGDTYTISVNGNAYTYTTTGRETSLGAIALALANQINSDPGLPVTAAASGEVISLTGDVPGTPFSIAASAGASGTIPAHLAIAFGDTPQTSGLITNIGGAFVGSGTAQAPASQNAGEPVNITFTVDYGQGPQQVTLNLGRFGEPGGVTQYAGRDLEVTRLDQDGIPAGAFQSLSIRDNGDVVLAFDNGRSRITHRVPLAVFADPNKLQREDGTAFTATLESGLPRYADAGTNGAGGITPSALEGANVDIADEFTKLIVTQRSYAANTRVLTTANEMLQEVLNIRR